jgi:hypothetical protein
MPICIHIKKNNRFCKHEITITADVDGFVRNIQEDYVNEDLLS